MAIENLVSYFGLNKRRCLLLLFLMMISMSLYTFIIYTKVKEKRVDAVVPEQEVKEKKEKKSEIEDGWEKVENGDGVYYVVGSYLRESSVNECELAYGGSELYELCFDALKIKVWVNRISLADKAISNKSIAYIEQVKEGISLVGSKESVVSVYAPNPKCAVSVGCDIVTLFNSSKDYRIECSFLTGYDKNANLSELYDPNNYYKNYLREYYESKNRTDLTSMLLSDLSKEEVKSRVVTLSLGFTDALSSKIQDQQTLKPLVSRGVAFRDVSETWKKVYRVLPNGVIEVSGYDVKGQTLPSQLNILRSFPKFNGIHNRSISDITYAGNFLWVIVPELNKLARVDTKRFMITKVYSLIDLKLAAKKPVLTKDPIRVYSNVGYYSYQSYDSIWNIATSSSSLRDYFYMTYTLKIDYSARGVAFDKKSKTFIISGSNWNTMYRIKIPAKDMYYKKKRNQKK